MKMENNVQYLWIDTSNEKTSSKLAWINVRQLKLKEKKGLKLGSLVGM